MSEPAPVWDVRSGGRLPAADADEPLLFEREAQLKRIGAACLKAAGYSAEMPLPLPSPAIVVRALRERAPGERAA